ncbi:MAG: hypothetical protein AAF414_23680 [Pseudomonadota bacterium]
MLGKTVILGVALLALAACQSGPVEQAAPADPLAPPATPPAPSPTVEPLGELETAAVSAAAYNGTFQGTGPSGQTIEVEIRDANNTGARINHLLTPSGPLLPGQAVWRNGAFTATMEQGTFVYTVIGPDALRYEGPGAAGVPVTVVLTRV